MNKANAVSVLEVNKLRRRLRNVVLSDDREGIDDPMVPIIRGMLDILAAMNTPPEREPMTQERAEALTKIAT